MGIKFNPLGYLKLTLICVALALWGPTGRGAEPEGKVCGNPRNQEGQVPRDANELEDISADSESNFRSKLSEPRFRVQ